MVQDQIVFCVQRGMNLEYVLSLGFSAFDSLYGSCLRNQAAEKIDDAIIGQIAAQGSSKNLDEALVRWRKVVERKPKDDLSAFISKFGGGI